MRLSAMLLFLALLASCGGGGNGNETIPAASSPQGEELTAPPSPSDALTAPGGCGLERWAVKTLTDVDASKVNLTPKASDVATMRTFRAPRTLPKAYRIAPVELTLYAIHADVVSFKLEADSDIHIVVAQQGQPKLTMIVELTDPRCAAGSKAKAQMQAARDAFIAICGQPSATSFTPCKASIGIVGVGFFDVLHGQTGVAPNGVELHPVLGIKAGP